MPNGNITNDTNLSRSRARLAYDIRSTARMLDSMKTTGFRSISWLTLGLATLLGSSSAAAQQPSPPPKALNTGSPGSFFEYSPRAYLDYSDGTFFLRSANDNLLIATGGRAHIDTYTFAGPNVSDYRRGNGSALGTYMFFRRFVLETGGIIRKHWFYWLGGNFAATGVDQNQAVLNPGNVYDGFIGYQANPHLQVYVGQYNIPVTMENVTSSRWPDFMERALNVRTIAAPYNKDLGVLFWGATREGAAPFEYQVGVFGGDGMNRPNVDTRFDGMARMLVRPLAGRKGALERFHIGVSGRYGSRDGSAVNYDAPTLSTPGGYAFWSPVYTTADKTEVHIIPSGTQAVAAGEFYLPFERIDVKSEFVYAYEEMREAASTARKATLRQGALEGWGGYVQLSAWPLGKPRVNGNPAGRYFGLRPPKDRGAEAPHGLQLVARAETMQYQYDGNRRSPSIADGEISATTTNIRAFSFQFATTYWATKHIRLTGEYSLYSFPGNPPSSGAAASNQAAAPGAKARTPDTTADKLHEISFRVGLAL
jgi:phosphate-selective porin